MPSFCRHRSGLPLILSCLLGLFMTTQPAAACRCAQRSLSDYFQAADEVFVARLGSATVQGDRRVFHFEAPLGRMKGRPGGLAYVSNLSSAACAVAADPGAVYVVFAEHDDAAEAAWLSSCNGSRIHQPEDGEARGFEDVPPHLVISQLNALAGLDLLQRIAANEPRLDDVESRRLVGLLDIAALADGGSVVLHRGPAVSTEVVATVAAMADLGTRESDYEVPSANVYAVVDGWHKLRLKGDRVWGWLPPARGDRFFAMDELPVRRLAYLNAHWDGFLWPEAGAGLPSRQPVEALPGYDRIEIPVNILESVRLAGTSLWWRVEILQSSPCGGGTPKVSTTGWIPAYGSDGEPAAWFYSRGC